MSESKKPDDERAQKRFNEQRRAVWNLADAMVRGASVYRLQDLSQQDRGKLLSVARSIMALSGERPTKQTATSELAAKRETKGVGLSQVIFDELAKIAVAPILAGPTHYVYSSEAERSWLAAHFPGLILTPSVQANSADIAHLVGTRRREARS